MNCSEEFFEKSEEYKSRDLTQMTTGQQSGSLLPSSASEASQFTNDDSEAIYYFGYGPIVNSIVRTRRGCKVSPENIRTAILYDHRLKFVAGGTANVVKSRGWDVKGVLMKFENRREWETFRQFDAQYDVREVSVSVIDKANLDPKNKNDQCAPFEDTSATGTDELDESIRSTGLVTSNRIYRSCLVSGNIGSLNDLGGSSSEEEDYSCPFSFEPKSQRADPNAIKCKTFMIDQNFTGVSHVINENASFRGGKISGGADSVFAKPQERYLRLMVDGLTYHDVDETYIRDEVLSVNYTPNERDKVDDSNYRTFPNAKKFTKISQSKYEKMCRSRDRATHFVIGNRIMKLDTEPDLNNACCRWLRAHGDGRGDMTLMIHQTFVDKAPKELVLPWVDKQAELTNNHKIWAEHVVVLYLERGDLTATAVGELISDGKPPLSGLKTWVKPHFKMLKGSTDRGSSSKHLHSIDFSSSVSTSQLDAPSSTQNLRGGVHSNHERSVEIRDRSDRSSTTKRLFGGAFDRMKKNPKNSKG